MLKKRTPFLVGLLVVIGAMAFLFTFGSLDRGIDLESAYAVHATFDDVSGLVEDSRVMLSGIPVGQIGSVRLDPDDPTRARVTMLISSDIVLKEGIEEEETGRYANGATVTRLQASLLGDYYIGITPGLAGAQIEPGGRIHNVINESGLTRVVNQLETSTSTIFPQLEKITDDIAAITGGVRESMAGDDATRSIIAIRENVRAASEEVAAMSADVRGFLNDSVLNAGGQVKNTLDNVESASAEFNDLAQRLDGRMDNILANVDTMSSDMRLFVAEHTATGAEEVDGTIAHTLASIDKSVAVMEGTVESARNVVQKVENGEGTIGRLMTDSKLIDDMEGVVADVRDLTATFGRLQVKVDFRNDFLIGQSALKPTVAFNFFPKPDKYYHFALVSDPQGTKDRTSALITTTDSGSDPVTLTETVETRSELKVTAQFAKKWHFLTLRYGVMESSGGLGLDLDLLEDALAIKLDVFEFGRDDFPRLRMIAAWEFAKHLYVSAGIDDVLNGDARDYFVGLGVSFADDDLKSLLPILPTSF